MKKAIELEKSRAYIRPGDTTREGKRKNEERERGKRKMRKEREETGKEKMRKGERKRKEGTKK